MDLLLYCLRLPHFPSPSLSYPKKLYQYDHNTVHKPCERRAIYTKCICVICTYSLSQHCIASLKHVKNKAIHTTCICFICFYSSLSFSLFLSLSFSLCLSLSFFLSLPPLPL